MRGHARGAAGAFASGRALRQPGAAVYQWPPTCTDADSMTTWSARACTGRAGAAPPSTETRIFAAVIGEAMRASPNEIPCCGAAGARAVATLRTQQMVTLVRTCISTRELRYLFA